MTAGHIHVADRMNKRYTDRVDIAIKKYEKKRPCVSVFSSWRSPFLPPGMDECYALIVNGYLLGRGRFGHQILSINEYLITIYLH